MGRLLNILLAILLSVDLFATTTEYPYVESQNKSDYGTYKIIAVMTDDDYTVVLWDNVTTKYCIECWISLSSNTILTYNSGSVRIKEWGFYSNDDFQSLQFDSQYSVQADRRYVLYMIFPKIPAGIDKISIDENIRAENRFYWKGIHIEKTFAKSDTKKGKDFSSSRNADMFKDPDQFTSKPTKKSNAKTQTQTPFVVRGSGTGFALNKNGYIATCYHVIDDARRIRVRGINGDFNKAYKVEVVSVNANSDLAILKIVDPNFKGMSKNPPYSIAKSVTEVGNSVFVLGYPLLPIMGDEIKLTNGIISSKSGYQGDSTTYQVSATSQPGNSGGPLFGPDGNVIGVVSAKLDVESTTYATKSLHLISLANSETSIVNFPSTSSMVGKTLPEQVKMAKEYVYIIEIE